MDWVPALGRLALALVAKWVGSRYVLISLYLDGHAVSSLAAVLMPTLSFPPMVDPICLKDTFSILLHKVDKI